ncbi:glutamate receptor ionotropic, delta-1-like [Scylla paramamosain]|uniref:glutamate receptor ionotropic, delta-1-like n=1 Tax=Scylla paramamosain TaxID=85552 RepID=UPI00308337CE
MVTARPRKCLDVLMEEFVNAVYVKGTAEKYHYSGPVVIALNILERHLDLCFRFFRSEQRTYGHSLSNGTWTGIIGQLQKQKVDFAGTLFTVSRERYGVIDFSEHIYLDEMTAAYVRPGVVPNMAGFVQPYTFLVR